MKDWYKKSFGHTYLELYAHRDKQEAFRDIERLIQWLSISRDELLLDLCCGTGRHLIALHEIGFRHIIGLDLSEDLLKFAALELSKAGARNVKLIHEDMRDIPYRNYFGVVLSLFTSFGYFLHDRENRKVIERVSKALKSGGIFVLDYINRDYGIEHLVSEDMKTVNDKNIINIRRLSKDQRRIEKTTVVLTNDGHKKTFYESVRLYSVLELQNIICECGFKKIKKYGSLGGEKFTPDSKRLVLVCEK
jgi:SAM-dependent methyltransferase